MKVTELLKALQIHHISVAITMVAIPLLIQLVQHKNSILESSFHILLLILLIAITRQIGYFRSSIQNLRENQQKNIESNHSLHLKMQNDFEKIHSDLVYIQSSLEKLKAFVTTQMGIEIEIVDRNTISPKEGYSKISSLIKKAQRKVKIVSPRKSSTYQEYERKSFLKWLESWLKLKSKRDRGFIYKRIILTEKDPVSTSLFSIDSQLRNHSDRVTKLYPNSAEIGCRFINQQQAITHFILIDNSTLIIFYPNLSIVGKKISQSDECAFYAIFRSKKQNSFKVFERQFDLLYNIGKSLNDFPQASVN